MNHTTDWNFIFVFVVGIIGILVSIVLYFENKSKSSRFLAAFLFTISIVSINYGLTITSFFLNYPNLWRSTGLECTLFWYSKFFGQKKPG